MTIQALSLATTGQFSTLLLDYLNQDEQVKPFYNQFPDIEGFHNQISQKKLSVEHRQTLVATLQKQYAGLENTPNFNILLDENTFTVTTGHQLNIFTGPLYVIYKIITILNLAKKLKAEFPDKNFVPVYWMASEDHDLAEIDHFSLFGKTYQWQTEQKGAVGRMNPAAIQAVLDEMPEKPEIFAQAYTQHATLADAARAYMHQLFGNEGLITIDADDRELKREFVPIMKTDLQGRTHALAVTETSEKLEELGYKTQITPRNINLFYLAEGLRERIVFEEGRYKVLNTNISFSNSEINHLLENEPERFSPNVVLRPVYQEVILPNLAYIGGPAEMPYWLQLKGVFDAHNLTFPILIPRNFGLYINKANVKKMQKLELSATALFQDEVTLRLWFVEHNSMNALSLGEETQAMSQIFGKVLDKAVKIDKTLEGTVNAEKQKLINALENLEKRLKKAEERNQETEITQLLALKQKLFPNGGLQERSENFLNFYLNNSGFLNQVSEVFDPLDFKMYVMMEE
jgi:bacillithiol synthase